jgi:hypothetical protein
MRPLAQRRDGRSVPLVRLGQGAYRREYFPLEPDMPTATRSANDQIDLRFLIREPPDVYHARRNEFLTAHRLAEFRRCPLLFHRKEQGLIPERDSHAFHVGRAAHVLILEGRARFEAEFAVGGPINAKTGQPYGSATKAFADWAQQRGKPALADDDAAVVEQIAASVKAHPFARELLAAGVAEGVIRCEVIGLACQARLDWINPLPDRGIVDLKTTDNLDGFELDIRAFGYVEQMAFYRALMAEIGGSLLPVHLIAVEKREPFRCGVWQLSPRVLDAAEVKNDCAMRDLVHCRETGSWPTGFESLRLYDRD